MEVFSEKTLISTRPGGMNFNAQRLKEVFWGTISIVYNVGYMDGPHG
jgi:hypothetical protein